MQDQHRFLSPPHPLTGEEMQDHHISPSPVSNVHRNELLRQSDVNNW